MADDFSEYPPDEFEVPDEQMGLWDMPPEPPFDDDLDLMPSDPSDFDGEMPPELHDVEPSDIDEPFDESYKPDYGLPTEPEFSPSSANVWERYLDSFSPNKNPDVLEAEQRDRAQTLNLLDARFHRDRNIRTTTGNRPATASAASKFMLIRLTRTGQPVVILKSPPLLIRLKRQRSTTHSKHRSRRDG